MTVVNSDFVLINRPSADETFTITFIDFRDALMIPVPGNGEIKIEAQIPLEATGTNGRADQVNETTKTISLKYDSTYFTINSSGELGIEPQSFTDLPATSVLIWGQAHDHTGNVTGALTGATNITGSNANMTIQPLTSNTSRNLTIRGNSNTGGSGGGVNLGHHTRGINNFYTGNTSGYRFFKPGSNSIYMSFDFNDLTSSHTFKFPDSDGTLAILEDLDTDLPFKRVAAQNYIIQNQLADKLGLGSTTPAHRLTIRDGNISLIDPSSSTNSGQDIQWYGGGVETGSGPMARIRGGLTATGGQQKGYLAFDTAGVERLRIDENGKTTIKGSAEITGTLDGTFTGTFNGAGTIDNADKLDNLNSTQFLRSDDDDTTSGNLGVRTTLYQNLEKSNLTVDGQLGFDSSQGLIVRRGSTSTTVLDGSNVQAGSGITISNLGAGGTGTEKFVFTVSSGSGSGLDADTLRTRPPATAATGNTIVQRESDGDINARYFMGSYMNMSHARATRNSDSTFYSSTDDYIRKNDASGMRSSLNVPTRTGGNASGTWGINVTGSAASATTATTATNANKLSNRSLSDGSTKTTVAGRNSSGDIVARLFRSEYANQTTISGAMAFRINNSSDNYIRFCSDKGAIRTFLNVPTRTGGNASGTWGINITGSASSATTATTATNATNATNATTATNLVINYNNNSNSTYQMLWGSGNKAYGTAGITCNPNSNYIYSTSMQTSSWFRSTGDTGWYSQTHGGGINMEDTTWVRVYGDKKLYVKNEIAATGDVTAFYSDSRLKTNLGNITGALDKVCSLNGFYYKHNELAKTHGYESDDMMVGVSAQEVKEVLPEVVTRAPFDIETDFETGELSSKTGENYMTVKYEKMVPLLIEAIKELKAEIEQLKGNN